MIGIPMGAAPIGATTAPAAKQDVAAELAELKVHIRAMHGATVSILHVIVQALETAGIDRIRIEESIINSADTARQQEQDAAQQLACDLMQAFAQNTLARPEPRPRPTLTPIDGGKP